VLLSPFCPIFLPYATIILLSRAIVNTISATTSLHFDIFAVSANRIAVFGFFEVPAAGIQTDRFAGDRHSTAAGDVVQLVVAQLGTFSF
jgi:hypothetical protein